MINTLPPDLYKNMLPIGQWLMNRWVPSINVPVPIGNLIYLLSNHHHHHHHHHYH